ncbi:major histocompatibility complex class I-related gene protein-like isoform X2 [Protopterus annectens]|uniref:major histocompatibility complex class I-related gene protein-like isoform X2 n=1 Tax=Protopterus annectens TaxID=7888 RepID=UPI001CFC3B56|nr:major histocompatibility complex class I-related gene protein-like isoform X2 [Protopterus annectens]
MYTLMDPEMWDMFVSRDVCQWQKFYLSFLIILAVAFPTVTPSVTTGVDPVGDGILSLACYIHGFFPRNIEVFWLENGESITEKMTTTTILPNSDNTFSVIAYVDTEENNKNKYTCMVKHSSLTNGVNVTIDFNQGFKTGYYVGGVLAFVGIITGITGIILRCKPKALRSCIEGRTSGHAEMVHGRETRNEELKQLDESPEVLNENMFDPLNPESAYLTIEDVPTIGVTSSVSLGQSASTTVE